MAGGRAGPRTELADRVPARPASLRRRSSTPGGSTIRRRRRGRRVGVRRRPRPAAVDDDGRPRYAPASMARALVAVRSFHRFCARRGLRGRTTRPRSSQAGRVPQGIPKALTRGRGRGAARRGRRRRPPRAARPGDPRDALRRRAPHHRARRPRPRATSTSTAAWCGCSARAARSGSSRSAARPRAAIAEYLRRGRPELDDPAPARCGDAVFLNAGAAG